MSIIPPHTQLHSLEIFYKYEFISMSIIIIPPHTQFARLVVYWYTRMFVQPGKYSM